MSGPLVREHMTESPHTIGKDQTLDRASAVMRAHGIRHLPVLEGGTLLGILSNRDVYLIETLDDVDPASVTVEEAMTAEPYAVAPDTPLKEVVDEMIAHKYGAAVVMEGRDVSGIFTTIDALRVLSARL
ncbi:MAG: CBS domain-containing protein [Sandaracinaceae bacterium]|nr:CBS domain-containing protein [Sandaracinaceae bacterium]